MSIGAKTAQAQEEPHYSHSKSEGLFLPLRGDQSHALAQN